MATAVIMPRQGQSVESCILGQWFKSPGDEVKTGDLLFSYETDKASFEEEAKVDGILLACFFEEGDEVPVLSEVALIGDIEEALPEKESQPVSASRPSEEEPALQSQNQYHSNIPEVSASRLSEEDPAPRVFEFSVESDISAPRRTAISPLARNIAQKLGVDISQLRGSGPHGRIIARDVEAAASSRYSASELPDLMERTADPHFRSEKTEGVLPHISKTEQIPPLKGESPEIADSLNLPAGDDSEVRTLTNIRKMIARAMHASLQNSAQLTNHLSADARQLLALRNHFKEEANAGKIPERITINDLVSWAVIRALKKFPALNSHFLGDQIRYFKKIHLGMAVDSDRGLMVVTLRDADDLSLRELSARISHLAAACRKGNINPDLLAPTSASFTISNLGNYGVESFTPIINLPQTAILGVCTILPRPKDLGNGVFGFVPHIGLSLTYDHRAVDGGEASRFMAEIARQIENLSF